jgi:hypothetical protein
LLYTLDMATSSRSFPAAWFGDSETSRRTTQRRAPLVDILTVAAIDAVYLVTFVLAAWLKWSAGVPAWFARQFAGTWLAHLPGGLTTPYYAIAVLETTAALGFVVSVGLGEFLRRDRPVFTAALVWSQLVFAVLVYGSRLTEKYDVAFTDFGYFLATFVILGWTRRAANGA